jgi:hypothetical protein
MVIQASAQAPASLLAAAAADPTSFAHLLAEAGIPAGLEIREPDMLRVSTPTSRRCLTVTREELTRETTVPIEQVVMAFNLGHTGYRAAMMEGVLVIRPVPRSAAYLDSNPPFGQLRGRGLMRFAEKVFAPADPRLDQPGGRVSSVSGPVGVEIDRGDDLDLVIDAVGLTALEVLNQIARLAPGHPWLVVTTHDDTPRVERFGFGDRYGTTTTLAVR